MRGKAKTGRTAKLSKEQKEEIKNALINPPKESGYYKWDGISLSDCIKNQYDIDLCVRQCQRLFHKLGFSKIRPQTYPSLGESNEEEREAFKKITDLANNPNAFFREKRELYAIFHDDRSLFGLSAENLCFNLLCQSRNLTSCLTAVIAVVVS